MRSCGNRVLAVELCGKMQKLTSHSSALLFVLWISGMSALGALPSCVSTKPLHIESQSETSAFSRLIGNHSSTLAVTCHLAKGVALSSLSPDGKVAPLSVAPVNSDIQIVGETYLFRPLSLYASLNRKFYSGGYFLVRSIDSPYLWDGWLSMRIFRPVELKSESPDFPSFPNMFIIAPNNRLAVFIAGDVLDRMEVTSRRGSVLFSVDIPTIRKRYENATQIDLLGWSTNSRFVWFSTYMESVSICFGRIDVNSDSYHLFDLPKGYSGYDSAIDYDTGQIVYSDHPNPHFQMVKDAKEYEKNATTVFHLYEATIGSPDRHLLATNTAHPFNLKKVGQHAVTYYSTAAGKRLKYSFPS